MRRQEFLKECSVEELNATIKVLWKIDNVGPPLTKDLTVPEAVSCINNELKDRKTVKEE